MCILTNFSPKEIVMYLELWAPLYPCQDYGLHCQLE